MAVRINEAALGFLLNSTVGPVGQFIGREADRVATQANQNASGEVIGIETGALVRGIRTQLTGTPEGVRAVVFTDAVARYTSGPRRGELRPYQGAPFSYPAYWDREGGRQWLTEAMREVFG